MKMMLMIGTVLALALIAMFFVGRTGTERILKDLHSNLKSQAPTPAHKVRFSEFESLPRPVSRYFRTVLKDGQEVISEAVFEQAGRLRTSPHSQNWMNFTATQQISPFAPGFVWNARVELLGPFQIRVLDSYIRGVGSGMVRMLSAFTVGQDHDTPELNSGALHRYLAEAVWYPTALLPQFGVQWSPIDENRALATLKDRDVKVSLEFRFNDQGEVSGIYSPGRWGAFEGGYKQVAWEGRFHDYQDVQGLRVPSRGEVGWYESGAWEPVWQGHVVKAEYQFPPR